MSTQIESAVPKRFAEFFAGIGLVRCALEKSGWQCVYANDFDEKKQEQYEAKFGGTHFHLDDIFNTDEVVSRIPNPVTLATASFPCIDLSLAGHWRGIDGEHSSAVFGFVDCLRAIEAPQILLLENVVGLLSSNKGKDFARLATLLGEHGYWLDAFRMDARFFVPQSRPRIFIVAVHGSLIDRLDLPKSTDEFALGPSWESSIRKDPEVRPERLSQLILKTELETGWFCSGITTPPESRKPLKELIDLSGDQDWWDAVQVKKHYDMMHDSHRHQVDNLLRSGEFFVGTIYRRKRAGKTRAEVRFDGIAGCLRTPKGGSARQIVITTDRGILRIRWMNPREYARLQGADDFPLVGKTNQQLFGFGDAVCVPVIEWIDKTVLTPLVDCIAQVTQ